MNAHSWRTVIGLAILALIGGFQALHGQAGLGWTDTVVAVLLAIEHGVNGNVGN